MARDHGRDAGTGMRGREEMAGTGMRGRDRKGFTIFGDLIWIVVFCAVAFVVFFALFKPLVDSLNDKTERRVDGLDIQPVYSDAQYLAMGVVQGSAEAGSAGKQSSTFGDVVRNIATRRDELPDDDDAFEEYVEGSGYRETLDRVFGKDSPFWTGAGYRLSDGTSVVERRRVGVIVLYDGNWLDATCREYRVDEGVVTGMDSFFCDWFNSFGNDIRGRGFPDPDTRVLIPDYDFPVEVGSVHVPTPGGAATVFVFVNREESS